MFGFLANLYHVLLYQPMFNSLVALYDYLPGHDFGIAIIFLTITIRFILYPLSVKSVNSQRGLQKLQPMMQEIQKKYKDNKEKQAQEMLELYKREKINPFSGIFLAFIQLPILIALYQVFWNGLNPEGLSNLYSFVANPIQINPLFVNLIDLSKPNIVFAVLAGLVQYWQTKMLLPKKEKNMSVQGKNSDMAQAMQTQMTYFMPIFTIMILFSLPSALGLYWIVSGIFSIIQQKIILKNNERAELNKNN